MQRKLLEDKDEAAYVDSFFLSGGQSTYYAPVRQNISLREGDDDDDNNISGRATDSSNDVGDEVQYFLPDGILDDDEEEDDDDDNDGGSGLERTPKLASTLPISREKIDGEHNKAEAGTGFLVDSNSLALGRGDVFPTLQSSNEIIAGNLKSCGQKYQVVENQSSQDDESSSKDESSVVVVPPPGFLLLKQPAQQLQGKRRSSRTLNSSQSGLTNNTIDFVSELSMSSLGRSSFTDQVSESTDQASESITESTSLRSEFDTKVSNRTGPTHATADDNSKLERAFGRRDMWNSQSEGSIRASVGVEYTAADMKDRAQKQSVTSTTLTKTDDLDNSDDGPDLYLENQQETVTREPISAKAATVQTPSPPLSFIEKSSLSIAQQQHSVVAATAAATENDREFRWKTSVQTGTRASKKPKRPPRDEEKNQGKNAKVKFAQPQDARDKEFGKEENAAHYYLFHWWKENVHEPLSHLFRFVSEVYEIFSPLVQQVFLLAGSVSIFCTKLLIVILWGTFRLIQYSITGAAMYQADGAIICYLVLYATPFACDVLMTYSFVTLPHFTPHILSNIALFCLCNPSRELTPTRPSTSGVKTNNKVGEELCQQILQMIKTCVPISFVLEGFSQPSSDLMMRDAATRVIFAYVLTLLRNSQILSPVAWVGWALQVLFLTWIPGGKILVSLLFILGLGFVRLITDLEARTSHRSRANTSESR